MCLARFSSFRQSLFKNSAGTSQRSDNKDVLPKALYKRVNAVICFLYYLYICVYIILPIYIAKIVHCFSQEHPDLLSFLS